MNLLEVNHLSKNYKNFSLKNINLTIPAGYIMGYVGQNGAGKTTTIHAINHICKFFEGTIKVNGISYEENPIKYKESIAYVGDESYFPKSAKINLVRKTMKDFYPTFDEEKFNGLMEHYELPENKKIEDFSRGMKVKLMFAAAFSRDAKLLILDEATNGLDPIVREELLSELQAYSKNGDRSVLFSTHILNDLEEIADYITFIDAGEIVLSRSKDEMLEDYLLIQGDFSKVNEKQKAYLIGLEEKPYGFEAIIESENGPVFGNDFSFDKPQISQIMFHSIIERRKNTI